MPAFDPGPPAAWATLFDQAPLAHYVTQQTSRFRTAFGPVFYRGRLDGTARVLVIGQDPSTDEILAQRILVGSAGQQIQRLLRKLGVTSSYVMFNAFLFGVTGQFNAQLRSISAADPILSYRNSLFEQVRTTNALEAVIAFGLGARHAVELWPGLGAIPFFHLVHPTAASNDTSQWNAALPQVGAAIAPDPGGVQDLTPYGATLAAADLEPIPRRDLPFGLPSWHGTGKTHSKRLGPDRIRWSRDVEGGA